MFALASIYGVGSIRSRFLRREYGAGMTIAACYVTNEGIVFGADSTTTFNTAVHYDCAQKVFEYGGTESSLGFMTWGIGSPGSISYREFVAETADLGPQQNHASFDELVQFVSNRLWSHYVSGFGAHIAMMQNLLAQIAAMAAQPQLTPPQLAQLEGLRSHAAHLNNQFSGGFCLGGRWGTSRQTNAYWATFNLTTGAAPVPAKLPLGLRAWGCPNLMLRLIHGIDPGLMDAILQSDRWQGTRADLEVMIGQQVYSPPVGLLPVREAIDYVHAMAYSTIKAMKFSQFGRLCGGPVELAVVTADRPFRWVRHKPLGQALATHLLAAEA